MIRQYNDKDINEIAKLGLKLHDNYVFSLDEFSNCLVIEENNKIIGFITYSIIYERAEVIDIIIDEKERKKGYGNKLLSKVIEIAKENNCTNITMEVNVNNESAINLYKKNGFKIVSNRKNYYNDNDAYLMELKLEVVK